MPLPPCLGLECGSPAATIEKHDKLLVLPTGSLAEPSPQLERKSQQPHGLEQLAGALAKQQATLQGVVEMQEELRGLLESQHRAVEARLLEILRVKAAPRDTLSQAFEGVPAVGRKSPGPGSHENPEQQAGQASDRSKSSRPKIFLASSAASLRALPEEGKEEDEEDEEEASPAKGGLASVREAVLAVRRCVESPAFEVAMGFVVLLHFAVSFAEYEWQGYDSAYKLGIRGDNAGWPQAEPVFRAIDNSLNAFYAIELLLRMALLRSAFFRDWTNACDVLVVLISCLDSFVLQPMLGEDSSGLGLLRFVKVLRVLRFMRIFRVVRMLKQLNSLRIFVRTLSMSIDSLVWSMMIMALIILAAAMLMVRLCLDVIEDEARTTELRVWVYRYFGSAMRASYTMFEATFSAKWATHLARPLIEDISPWFSLFWIIYIVLINFAVTRIVAALFLRQTMALAQVDAERTTIQKMRQKDKVAATLRRIFAVGDTSGDGVITRSEFEAMIVNPDVCQMFAQLHIEPDEARTLFNLLSEDDNVADQEEFLSGALHLKANARTIDTIQVLHELMVTKRSIDTLQQGIEQVASTLNPQSPWNAAVHSLDEA